MKKWLPLSLLGLLLFSCEADNYDKGEGEYSLMRADFVEAHTDGEKRIDYVVTDEGDSLAATPLFSAKGVETADTIYRAILYYNKVRKTDGTHVAEPKGLSLVPTLTAVPVGEMQVPMKTDPLQFESLWLATNRRYLNLSIIVLTGKADDEELQQTVALVQDSLVEHADGKRTACYRLFHDQGNVPQYYSSQHYLSIPLSSILADTLRLSIQTYDGLLEKTVVLSE